MKTTAQVMGFTLFMLVSSMAGCVGQDMGEGVEDETALEEEVGETELASTVLGGLDLDRQCRRRHGGSAFAVLLQPVISPGAAYAWRCYQNGTYHHIDMRLFCIWQYNNFNAVDAFSDFNNAYSWYCYLP